MNLSFHFMNGVSRVTEVNSPHILKRDAMHSSETTVEQTKSARNKSQQVAVPASEVKQNSIQTHNASDLEFPRQLLPSPTTIRY